MAFGIEIGEASLRSPGVPTAAHRDVQAAFPESRHRRIEVGDRESQVVEPLAMGGDVLLVDAGAGEGLNPLEGHLASAHEAKQHLESSGLASVDAIERHIALEGNRAEAGARPEVADGLQVADDEGKLRDLVEWLVVRGGR